MKQEHIDSFEKLFAFIYKGDKGAIELSFVLLRFLHIWDDIKDEDPFSKEEVDSVFFDIMTKVSGCPLWDSHLQGCFMSVYFRWQAANQIETADATTLDLLQKAWMLRAGLYDLFVLLAAKLYGRAWADSISVTVYAYYGESLEDFLHEVGHA